MKTDNLTLKTNDKMALVGNLATMLSSGIPILESVDSLLEDVKGNQKKILETLRTDLNQGRQVHETFSRFPRAFSRVMVNVIKAAERAGTLDVTLKDLRENIKREAELIDKIRSALIYPAFIFIVFFGVLLLILFLVIPKISAVFGRLNVELPLPTRILLFVSDLLIDNGLYVLLGTIVFLGTSAFLFARNKKKVLNILSYTPIVSGVVAMVDVTRFSRSLYLLLSSGMPIIESMELAEDSVIRSETAAVIAKAREMVMAGKTLSAGFKAHKRKFPMIMLKLMEAGEKTGTLDKSMQEISEHFDYEVTSSLKTLTALIEPVMLVLVGVVVGGMMMAIITPIYGLIGQVGNL